MYQNQSRKKEVCLARDMSRKQLVVLFSNKQSPETVYLDSLLKKNKAKNSV